MHWPPVSGAALVVCLISLQSYSLTLVNLQNQGKPCVNIATLLTKVEQTPTDFHHTERRHFRTQERKLTFNSSETMTSEMALADPDTSIHSWVHLYIYIYILSNICDKHNYRTPSQNNNDSFKPPIKIIVYKPSSSQYSAPNE